MRLTLLERTSKPAGALGVYLGVTLEGCLDRSLPSNDRRLLTTRATSNSSAVCSITGASSSLE